MGVYKPAIRDPVLKRGSSVAKMLLSDRAFLERQTEAKRETSGNSAETYGDHGDPETWTWFTGPGAKGKSRRLSLLSRGQGIQDPLRFLVQEADKVVTDISKLRLPFSVSFQAGPDGGAGDPVHF